MSENSSRRRFTTEQKVAILRRHLVDKVPVSDLCDEYRIQPSLFYVWQRQALEHLDLAVEAGAGRRGRESRQRDAQSQRITALEAKLARKDQVIAEISEEYVRIKKGFFIDFRDLRVTRGCFEAMLCVSRRAEA